MGYYAEISAGYNALYAGEQAEKAGIIAENLPIRGLLLDVGAGTGISTKIFEGKAECIALDPCIELLRQYSGLRVIGRAEQLPFKSGSFDCVVSVTALHHCDVAGAKREILRVAKEGAPVGISFFRRAKNFPLAKRLFAGSRAVDSGKDAIFLLQRITAR
jgi:ubiquinone/menaquinone biosynthesis C-methylase UbiE